jgi:hypothetical protein
LQWECPWIPSVKVLSKEKDVYGRYIDKSVKCMIDTGNLQGNLVSKGLLTQHLRYRESDFLKLKKYEREGVSPSGHLVVPEAAIKLDWYHPSSSVVYRGMRFLVVPSENCELVLCARTIDEHKILTPPNFMNADHNVVQTKEPEGM